MLVFSVGTLVYMWDSLIRKGLNTESLQQYLLNSSPFIERSFYKRPHSCSLIQTNALIYLLLSFIPAHVNSPQKRKKEMPPPKTM